MSEPDHVLEGERHWRPTTMEYKGEAFIRHLEATGAKREPFPWLGFICLLVVFVSIVGSQIIHDWADEDAARRAYQRGFDACVAERIETP